MNTLARASVLTQVTTACFVAYLYFVFDFFLRFSARIPGYGSLRPTLLAVVLITLLLFLQKVNFKNRIQDPIFKIIIVLIVYLIISLPLVAWPGSVLKYHVDTFVKAVVFFFFTALIIDSEKRLKVFLTLFLSTQLFRVFEPLYLNITQGYWGDQTYIGAGEFAQRLGGAPADVINPNELGFVIVTVIPYLHFLLWHGRWYCKAIYLVLLPLLLYALVLTMSRGAFLALVVVALFIFKESQRKLQLLIVCVCLAVSFWGVMSDHQRDRYRSLLGGEGAQAATAEGRIGGSIEELKLGLSRPIVGHGLGTTNEAKVHLIRSTKASHNLYAELLIEIGFVGAFIFFVFFKRIFNAIKSSRQKIIIMNSGKKCFFYRLNLAMTAVFWMYVVYSTNYWGLSQYYWYLLGGMVLSYSLIINRKYISNGRSNGF